MGELQKLTLKHLEAYKGNKAEITRLGAELASLRVEHDIVKGSLPVFPYTPATIHIYGVSTYGPGMRGDARIRRRRERLQARQRQLEQYVAGIPDPLIRCIVELRYIGGLSWGSVAKSIGGCNTSDSVRKAVKRYFSTVSG